IDLCSVHEGKVRAKILDSMMMANLPPVMLPPLTDYGMLTPTLGIKVSRDHPVWIGSVSNRDSNEKKKKKREKENEHCSLI
ncbi:hypothetical protein WH47_06172, partial [Habropoda laboriosa]